MPTRNPDPAPYRSRSQKNGERTAFIRRKLHDECRRRAGENGTSIQHELNAALEAGLRDNKQAS